MGERRPVQSRQVASKDEPVGGRVQAHAGDDPGDRTAAGTFRIADDFHAIKTGFVSITPIHVDLTRYQALDKVAGWVGELAKESAA